MLLSLQDEVVEGLVSASGIQQGEGQQSEQALKPHLKVAVPFLFFFSL